LQLLYHSEPDFIKIDRFFISKDIENACVLVYFDFDNFKPYNDRYGFRQGDRTILLFSDILKKTSGANKFFAGHIGGDDFFAGFRIGALDKVSIDNKIQRCIIRSLLK